MKRRLLLLALVLSLLLPPSLIAGPLSVPQRRRQPAPQQKRPPAVVPTPVRLPEAKLLNRVLANGLEVIVLEDHSLPLVTIEMAVRNGSFTEPPELNGLSHLYEHMFFKSNRATAAREDYLGTIGKMGISYNASTREEVVNYYFSTTSPNLRTAMQFMKDSVRYPLFIEAEFERERAVVISEIDRNESNPYFYLLKARSEKLFFKYPSRKSPLGNRQTVSAATTETMRLIQSRYYVPNNAALVVTGDVEPETVFAMAQEFYGDWARGEDPFKKFPLVEHPPLPKSEGLILTQPIENVVLDIGWHGPSIGKDDAATYAADVFSFILNQPNSRFQTALVDTGLVNNVAIGYYTQRNVGPISIIAQTTPDKARAALKAIYAEIARFNDKDYYTDEQLESAKALLEADDLYSREKLSEYAHTLSFWWSSTGLEYFRGYLGRLRATSRAEISRYVTTYIQGKPHIGIVMLSDSAQARIKFQPAELVAQ